MGERRIRPPVILPGTSPRGQLAAADALLVLNGLGRVAVVDVAALNATSDPGKP